MDLDAVIEPVGSVAGCQDHARVELAAQAVAQSDQPARVFALHVTARFDLEPADDAVIAFDDQIDFLAVMGSPVTHSCGVVAPRCLFEKLTDDKGLEQVAELGES